MCLPQVLSTLVFETGFLTESWACPGQLDCKLQRPSCLGPHSWDGRHMAPCLAFMWTLWIKSEPSPSFSLISFIIGGETQYVTACLSWAEGSFRGLVFPSVGSRDQAQVLGLGITSTFPTTASDSPVVSLAVGRLVVLCCVYTNLISWDFESASALTHMWGLLGFVYLCILAFLIKSWCFFTVKFVDASGLALHYKVTWVTIRTL